MPLIQMLTLFTAQCTVYGVLCKLNNVVGLHCDHWSAASTHISFDVYPLLYLRLTAISLYLRKYLLMFNVFKYYPDTKVLFICAPAQLFNGIFEQDCLCCIYLAGFLIKSWSGSQIMSLADIILPLYKLDNNGKILFPKEENLTE